MKNTFFADQLSSVSAEMFGRILIEMVGQMTISKIWEKKHAFQLGKSIQVIFCSSVGHEDTCESKVVIKTHNNKWNTL